MGFLFTALFVLVPLIWLPWTSELFEFNKLMLTYVIAILIGTTWAIKCILAKKIIFKRTILDIPLLFFLLSTFLSLLFSIDIHTSWYGYYSRWNGGLLSLLTYSFLYWAYVSNMDSKSTKSTIFYSLISVSLISVYASLEHFGSSISCLLVTGQLNVSCWVQDVQNRVYASMGQPNWLAAYLVSLIFIPLTNLLKSLNQKISNTTNKKVIWHLILRDLLIFCLLFATLLFTKSRSGLLAFGISSVVFWGMQQNKKALVIPIVVWSLFIGALTLIINNPVRDLIFKPTVIERSVGPALEVGGTESGSIRKIVWKGAVNIWLGNVKNFMIGSGPETFAQSYYQYRPIEHNNTSEWELLYNKAHNEYLNYLATTGILGFGSYLIFLFTSGWILIKSQIPMTKSQISSKFQNSKSSKDIEISLGFENWSLRLALFAGWLTILVTNFWGFSVVVTQLLLFLMPAMAFSLEQQSDKVSSNKVETDGSQVIGIIIILLVTLSLCYFVTRYWLADFKYSLGASAHKSFQMSNDPQYLISAYQNYYEAYQYNPSEPALASDLGLSEAYLATAMRAQATAAAQLASQSLLLSQFAINTSPNHPNYYKNLTRGLILLSEIDSSYLESAKQAMLAASTISPTDPRIPYYLGIILSAQGATPEAKLYFQKSLFLKPDFFDAQRQLK